MPFLFEGRVFGLNLGRVAEHQFDQVGRGEGGDDGAAKTLLHQLRRQSAVVDVGVRQQHRVEIAEPQRAAVPVPLQIGPLLMHAAVDQEPRTVGLDIVLRAGDLACGPQKLQFHGAVLGECTGLEGVILSAAKNLGQLVKRDPSLRSG